MQFSFNSFSGLIGIFKIFRSRIFGFLRIQKSEERIAFQGYFGAWKNFPLPPSFLSRLLLWPSTIVSARKNLAELKMLLSFWILFSRERISHYSAPLYFLRPPPEAAHFRAEVGRCEAENVSPSCSSSSPIVLVLLLPPTTSGHHSNCQFRFPFFIKRIYLFSPSSFHQQQEARASKLIFEFFC